MNSKTYRYIKYLRNGKTEEGVAVVRVVGTSYWALIIDESDDLNDSKSPSIKKVNKTKQQKVN